MSHHGLCKVRLSPRLREGLYEFGMFPYPPRTPRYSPTFRSTPA